MNFFISVTRSRVEESQGLVLRHSKGMCTTYSPWMLNKEEGQVTKNALFSAVLSITSFPIACKP